MCAVERNFQFKSVGATFQLSCGAFYLSDIRETYLLLFLHRACQTKWLRITKREQGTWDQCIVNRKLEILTEDAAVKTHTRLLALSTGEAGYAEVEILCFHRKFSPWYFALPMFVTVLLC